MAIERLGAKPGSNGANFSQAWVGPNEGVAFLVVMNGRDFEGLTEGAARDMTLEMIDYYMEYMKYAQSYNSFSKARRSLPARWVRRLSEPNSRSRTG